MNGGYSVRIKSSAEEEARKIPPSDFARIQRRILALRDNPRPHGVEKLAGGAGYRIRQGDYRILFTIDDSSRTVFIFKIGHRREVYR